MVLAPAQPRRLQSYVAPLLPPPPRPLRRGESIEGFGHPLYPGGDPRARVLFDLLRQRYPKSAERLFIQEFLDASAPAVREKPNVDFALAAVARVLRLPAGSPLVLFAI